MSKSINKTSVLTDFSIFALLLIFTFSLTLTESSAKTKQRNKSISHGETIYAENCQSCHRQGTNPLKPEAQLAESTKLVSQKSFKDFLSSKHGLMPNFESIATHESNLKNLYDYVKTLSNQSWEYPQHENQPQDPPMKDQPPKTKAE